MPVGNRPSRKWWYIGAGGVLLVVGTAAGFATLSGASPIADPSKMASVERGTMVRSVVATGKIEPITKVEIKSKANGIIKALHVDVDSVVKPNDVLVELDREQLEATLRGAEANLQAARASLEGAQAALKKNIVEAEGPDVEFARRAYDRAKMLFAERLIAQSALDDAHSAVDLAENRKRAARVAAGGERSEGHRGQAQVAQAKAVADRDAEDLPTPRFARPSVARCSAATSRSAAPSRRSSTSARTPRW